MVMWTSALVLLLGMVVGFVVGRELSVRRRTRAIQREIDESLLDAARLHADLKAARVDRDYYHQRFEQALLDLARVGADRDRYRDAAATHTVQWPDAPPEPVKQPMPVWRGRRYAHHPESNLASLRADLEPHLDKMVRLALTVVPMGGWASRIREIGPIEWEGPGARVLDELIAFLHDDDLRMMRRVQGTDAKVWSDPDSPIRFEVDLDLVTTSPPGVHIHEVEVVHVEVQVEERVIEQPVVIEVPTRRLGAQTPEEGVTLSREEVLALFEVELERKLAEFGLQRAPESDGLSMVTTQSDADRRRRGLAARKVRP